MLNGFCLSVLASSFSISFLILSPIMKAVDETYRVLKDKGVYILITYGAPIYRLRLFKESCSWTTKLHVIDKSLTDQPLDTPKWELTKPLPLDADGSSVESAIGKNPDVHYIYVCIKDESSKMEADAA